MGVLLDSERSREIALDRPPDSVQRADAGVAEPAEDELSGGSGGHHLVHQEIRREADQGEIPPPLPDDFVARGKGDQMGEPLEDHRVPSPTKRETASRMVRTLDSDMDQDAAGIIISPPGPKPSLPGVSSLWTRSRGVRRSMHPG